MIVNTSDLIRVTNIYQLDENNISFSGVALDCRTYKNAFPKRTVMIKTFSSKIGIEPITGQLWRVTGKSENRKVDTKNGFTITQTHYVEPELLQVVIPKSANGFSLFIGREPTFKGITENTARKIWNEFKDSIYQIIEDQNREALGLILSENKINTLFEGYRKYSNLKFSKWLSKIGIPLHIQQRLLKYHTENSINLIKKNPYMLSTFGMTFNDVDDIAKQHFNVTDDDERRLISALEHVLKQNEKQGHTIALRADLKRRLEKLLNDNQLASTTLGTIKQSTAKKVFIYDSKNKTYQLSATFVKEKSIALRFKHLSSIQQTELEKAKAKIAFRHVIKSVELKLTLGQVRAIYKALNNHACIITGGAGTGKTTVLKAILTGYKFMSMTSKCVALSGRAAKRMYESTSEPSTTIARLLLDKPIEPDLISSAKKNILVIDEASMIDVSTMFRIINHINPDTRLLLVGDPNQLPPIDSGLVLNDLVTSNLIPTTKLDIVKRQKKGSGIPEYSNKIAEGIIPIKLNSNNVHFHCVNESDINQECLKIYQQNIEQSKITAAVYKKEYGGIEELNLLCQRVINPNSEYLTFNIFGQQHFLKIKLNDPVIFTKNHTKSEIQNGTLGRLVSLANKEHYGLVELEGSGRIITLTQTLLDSIKPAYALSLHKAQGSQFERVIIPINNSRMIDQNWLYTAITRAEKEVHLIGPQLFLEQAISRKGATQKRKTGLKNILKSLYQH